MATKATHTFAYHPMRTAPKDRAIMLLLHGCWCWGVWDKDEQMFDTAENWAKDDEPLFWAEIADMAPPQIHGGNQ